MIDKSIIFISFVLCCLFVQPVYADTIVSFDLDGLDVASFEFAVVDEDYAVADFTTSLPDGWMDMSSEDTFASLDMGGSNSLTSGDIGLFTADGVILGNFVLGNQAAETLVQNSDYWVHEITGAYLVSASETIPIPGAFWLLGSALIGLVGVKRKFN